MGVLPKARKDAILQIWNSFGATQYLSALEAVLGGDLAREPCTRLEAKTHRTT